MMAVRIFPFLQAGSNMYVLTAEGQALIIDPCVNVEAMDYLRACQVTEITILLTHEHYDHTSGVLFFCTAFSKHRVLCQEEAAQALAAGKNNRPVLIASELLKKKDLAQVKDLVKALPQGYRYQPEIVFAQTYTMSFAGHRVHMVHTPGHSPGSCCIEVDADMLFTGDSLILHTPTLLRLRGSDSEQYRSVAVPYLQTKPLGIHVYPGHGAPFVLQADSLSEIYD